jgi:ABC-2 type transport system ATP-binding protein
MEILSVKSVSKSYATHNALKDINLAIPQQSIFGLLGPNGAGKTTLIRIIMQIIAADKGEILLEGKALKREDAGRMGYLPEERGLYRKMKVADQLLYLARLKGVSRKEAIAAIKKWLEKFNMLPWANHRLDNLSKGMQQKIQFIATVVHNPVLIILDEPFSGFDPINARLLASEIIGLKEQGATVILSTHRMESVESLCDHIAMINRSEKVLEGTPRNVRNAYRTNTFQVEYQGTPIMAGNHYEVLNNERIEDGYYRSTLSLRNGYNSSILISELAQRTEIREFRELLPSINDIFIRKVSES